MPEQFPHPFSGVEPETPADTVPFVLPLAVHDPDSRHPGIEDGAAYCIIFPGGRSGAEGIRGIDRAASLLSAEYICKAVNCHAELVEALTAMLESWSGFSDAEVRRRGQLDCIGPPPLAAILKARAVIAKATKP